MSTQTQARSRGRAGAALAVMAGLALGGCASWTPDWLAGGDDAPPAERAADASLYCYRSLAEVECYRAPLPDAEARRVGWVDVADDASR